MNKRIAHMSDAEYAYHFQWVGDDPMLSCNVLRLILLAVRWFRGIATPREEDELLNDLYYLRQRLHGWGERLDAMEVMVDAYIITVTDYDGTAFELLDESRDNALRRAEYLMMEYAFVDVSDTPQKRKIRKE